MLITSHDDWPALQIANLMRLRALRSGLDLPVRELLGELAGIGETVLLYQAARAGSPRGRRADQPPARGCLRLPGPLACAAGAGGQRGRYETAAEAWVIGRFLRALVPGRRMASANGPGQLLPA